MGAPLELNEFWLDRIRQCLDGMEYGNVQIIVHDGRIVQIERTERTRFEGGGKDQEQPPIASVAKNRKAPRSKNSN